MKCFHGIPLPVLVGQLRPRNYTFAHLGWTNTRCENRRRELQCLQVRGLLSNNLHRSSDTAPKLIYFVTPCPTAIVTHPGMKMTYSQKLAIPKQSKAAWFTSFGWASQICNFYCCIYNQSYQFVNECRLSICVYSAVKMWRGATRSPCPPSILLPS